MIAYATLRRTLLDYRDPTLEELLRLCRDFGLLTDFDLSPHGVLLRCVNQVFDVSAEDAELLLKGLLLGFFFGHSRDDLSLAEWDR